MLLKDFLRFFLVWNESIIHFGILLNKNGDIVPPLIKNFDFWEVSWSSNNKGFPFFKWKIWKPIDSNNWFKSRSFGPFNS